jgi:pyruvate kinase
LLAVISNVQRRVPLDNTPHALPYSTDIDKKSMPFETGNQFDQVELSFEQRSEYVVLTAHANSIYQL